MGSKGLVKRLDQKSRQTGKSGRFAKKDTEMGFGLIVFIGGF